MTAGLFSFLLRLEAYFRLGLANIARVARYRLALRLGVHPAQRLRRVISGIEFYRPYSGATVALPRPNVGVSSIRYFSWLDLPLIGESPDWHSNPFKGSRIETLDVPWWQLDDFMSDFGDIKTIWEASRFDWVTKFAQSVAAGESSYLARLNSWLADWVRENPTFLGPNWKCGQEASFRVIHLALAARFLNQLESPTPDMIRLVEAHLVRIESTFSYALAQENNHGTSEAAALFIGGAWLQCALGCSAFQSSSYLAEDMARVREQGRLWLENRVARLFEESGGFSQHSTNYHRLALDTLCVVELVRRWFGEREFSEQFYSRACAATRWLESMIDSDTGDAPNLGANDGAQLLPLTDADYRDYRPSVALASSLFFGQSRYISVKHVSHHLGWLGVVASESTDKSSEKLRIFKSNGYMVLTKGPCRAVFRYPSYQFRPHHCDALHIDFWFDSENVLRDDGTYSYNADPESAEYFGSTRAHNTVQFDDRDMMPKVSRFMRAAWLKPTLIEGPSECGGELFAAAAYCDWQGARHERRLKIGPSGMKVRDIVGGFRARAVLRWRLAPGEWIIEGSRVRRLISDTKTPGILRPASRSHFLQISASVPISNFQIVQGWESRYYFQKTPVPILEVEILQPGELVSEYGLVQ
jgi:hypothetical protein